MLSTLDVALEWLKQHPSHHIFPVRGKNQPLLTDYLNAASNDPGRITSQYEFWKHRLGGEEPFWGVAPKLSGLVVADVDTKPGKAGQQTYDLLDLCYGWPKTLMVRTPSGGFHCYFTGEHIFELGTAKTEHLGIDFPAYTIIPGCGEYKLLEDRPIAKAPQWLYHVTRRKNEIDTATQIPAVEPDLPANVEWAVYYLTHDAPCSVMGKNGEKVLRDVGAKLKDHGISYEKACELVQEHYNVFPTCDPPWEYDSGPIPDRLTVKLRNAYLYMTENVPGEQTPEAEFAADPPDPPKPEDAKAEQVAKKAAEKSATRKSKLKELSEEWAWIAQIDRWIKRADHTLFLKTEAFDKQYSEFTPPKASGISKALFDRFPNCKFERAVFAAAKPELWKGNYNMWRPSDIVAVQGDTTIWDAHLAYLFPEESDRNHVLNWMAWLLQNIELKPKHALLIAGHLQGTGKTFISDVLKRILGVRNVAPVGVKDLASSFNRYAWNTKLILIEELRALDKGSVKENLHTLITEEWLIINDKNIPTFMAQNCFGVMAMTNHDAAVSLDNSDRRHLVVRTHALPRDQAYYTDLYRVRDDRDAVGAVAFQLMHRDLGGYSALYRAPSTTAKDDMIEAGLSDLEHYILENAGNDPFTRRLVTLEDIIAVLPAGLYRGPRLRTTLASILKNRLQAEKIGQQRTGGGNERHVLWTLNGFKAWKDGDAIARIYLKDRDAAKHPGSKDFDEADES